MDAKLTNDGALTRLRELFAVQRFAVLATTENGQPYLSLMAFAATGDLQYLLIATNKATRKYRNIQADARIALLVDNRANLPADTEESLAVTALGQATEVAASDRDQFLNLYLAKHPRLEKFVSSPECALIRVKVERYLVVSHFQETMEVLPG